MARELTMEQKKEAIRRLRNLLPNYARINMEQRVDLHPPTNEQLEVWLDQFVECVQLPSDANVIQIREQYAEFLAIGKEEAKAKGEPAK